MTAVLRESASRFQIKEGRERYLAHTDNLMVVVIDFTDGPAEQPDPPHHHPHEQVSYIAEGELLFFMDGVPTRMGPGDLIAVPPNVPHCIQLLTPTARVVDSFNPIREDFV